MSGQELSQREREILEHTVHRAAGGRYCGGGKDMEELVRRGLMKSLGTFLGNPYFGITEQGRAALRLGGKEGA